MSKIILIFSLRREIGAYRTTWNYKYIQACFMKALGLSRVGKQVFAKDYCNATRPCTYLTHLLRGSHAIHISYAMKTPTATEKHCADVIKI